MKKYKAIIISVLIVLLYFMFAVVFFYIEKQSNSNIRFINVFDAIWYSIASFFSIGYGDIAILSIWGRLFEIGFILMGICFLGLIIGKINNLFHKQFEKRKLGHMGTNFKDHIIIIGWDAFASDVTKQLVCADKKVAVMTNRKDDIDLIYNEFGHKDIFVCFSDLKNYYSLEQLNAHEAKVIFLNNGIDADKLISILNIKKSYSYKEFVVLLDNKELKDTFVSAGVTYVLSKNEIASKMLASYIFEPAVADFTRDLISSTDCEAEYDIQQYKVCEDNPYKLSRYIDMFMELKNKHNIIAIGLNKNMGCAKRLIKAPHDDEIIDVGDDVIVIANGKTEKIMQKLFNVCEGA